MTFGYILLCFHNPKMQTIFNHIEIKFISIKIKMYMSTVWYNTMVHGAKHLVHSNIP